MSEHNKCPFCNIEPCNADSLRMQVEKIQQYNSSQRRTVFTKLDRIAEIIGFNDLNDDAGLVSSIENHIIDMNHRILALESRLAAALRRKAKPSPAATSIALVGLTARLKLRHLALREHIAKQDKFQQFADRLNALRLERGLTFEELGTRACIPAARVQAALHGDLDTELRDLVGLCLALKVRAQIALVPTVGGQPTVIPIGHTLPKNET